MSNSARFIIPGSEHGLGLSVSTCRMQIDHGLTNPLYLSLVLPCLQPWPAPAQLEMVSSTFPNTNLKAGLQLWQRALLCSAVCAGSGTLFILQETALFCFLSDFGLHLMLLENSLNFDNETGWSKTSAPIQCLSSYARMLMSCCLRVWTR